MNPLDAPAVRGVLKQECWALIPVGLPGTGKTRLAELLVKSGYLALDDVISTDALRIRFGGRRDWLGNEELVFDVAFSDFERKLDLRSPTYLDATNLNHDWRSRVLAAADKRAVPSLVIIFAVDPHLARMRRKASGIVYDDRVWASLEQAVSGFAPHLESALWTTNVVVEGVVTR